MARAQTFPELGIVQVVRGRRRGGRSQFDVCQGSGRKTDTRAGLPAICSSCKRVLRVTAHGNLPVHMRHVQTTRKARRG